MSKHFDRPAFHARLRELRAETYGDDLARVADALGIGVATWRNYESGVTIPDFVILGFVHATQSNPRWLLTGEGERHARSDKSKGIHDRG